MTYLDLLENLIVLKQKKILQFLTIQKYCFFTKKN
jgi:hypothetical protein